MTSSSAALYRFTSTACRQVGYVRAAVCRIHHGGVAFGAVRNTGIDRGISQVSVAVAVEAPVGGRALGGCAIVQPHTQELNRLDGMHSVEETAVAMTRAACLTILLPMLVAACGSNSTGGSGGSGVGGSATGGGSTHTQVGGAGGAVGSGGTTTPVGTCSDSQLQQVSAAVDPVVKKPAYDGCAESGVARARSTQCAYNATVRAALLDLGYCLSSTLRSDVDATALVAEARQAVGALACRISGCGSAGMAGSCVRNSVTYEAWCSAAPGADGSCDVERVCECANGERVPDTRECDGTPDCSDSSDEQGCCGGVDGFSANGACATEAATCLFRSGPTVTQRCTCTRAQWSCRQF